MPLSDDEIAARADDNYVAMWSMYATTRDGGEVRERDGLVLACSYLPAAMFNNAFVTRPLRDPDAQIAGAIDFFDGAEVPFCVRIREGLDPAAERACERLGLPYSDTVPGMALADLASIPPPMEGLQVRAATDAETRRQHRRIVERVFEMPHRTVELLLNDRIMTARDTEYYVGYVDGAPVATAALVVTHRVGGIANVATDPARRGRGIGEAMTWHAVRRAKAMGCVMANLQASEMGRPIYERMGFRMVSPYRTFHRPGV